MDALRDAGDPAAFASRRWFVRHVVAASVGCEPAEVSLHQRCHRCDGPHGRPALETPRGVPAPFVSWSSVGTLTVVAVDSAPVGIDVVAGEDRRDWARLEAVLKATGHGLEVDPSLVEIAAGRVRRWEGPGRRPRLWVTDLDAVDGHAVAVAHRPRGRFTPAAAAPAGRATG